MIEISYMQVLILVSCLWVLTRLVIGLFRKRFSWKRELQLLLVYICIVVVIRFTFFPFSKVDGKIQPMLFDPTRIWPFWLNFEPFVHMTEYPTKREILVNIVGNTAMFIPVGVIWPVVFRRLNKPWKVLSAGAGFSLAIELLQLPLFGRCSDVDDLILNTAGFAAGYGIYVLVKLLRNTVRRPAA